MTPAERNVYAAAFVRHSDPAVAAVQALRAVLSLRAIRRLTLKDGPRPLVLASSAQEDVAQEAADMLGEFCAKESIEKSIEIRNEKPTAAEIRDSFNQLPSNM